MTLTLTSERSPTSERSSPFSSPARPRSHGITLALSVKSVEPWSNDDESCSHDSCEVATPQDVRLVLKYEVTVPDDFARSLDAMGCPGDLSVVWANHDEALTGVMVGLPQLIEPILPGQTQSRVAEHYIAKSYVGQKFMVESACGDVDDAGERAYFVGSLPKGS